MNETRECGGAAGVRNIARANFISFLAISIVEFAVPFLAVTTVGASSAIVSLLAIARFLPSLLVSEIASVYVLRHGFRRAMLVGEVFRICAFVAAGAGALLSSQGIPLFVVALSMVSLAGTLSGVAIGDAVPYLAHGADRVRIYSHLSIAESSADAAGPFIGGILLSESSAPTEFAVCAGLAAVAVRLFWALPKEGAPRTQRSADGGKGASSLAITSGLRLNVKDRVLRSIFVWMVVYNLGQSIVMSVFLIAVTRDMGLTATEFGVLSSAVVIFAIAGAWWAGKIVHRIEWSGRLFQLAGMGTMAAYLLLGLSFLAPTLAAVFALSICLALEEFCSAVAGILIAEYRATVVPQERRPGVIAANRATVALSVVAGYGIGGGFGLWIPPIPIIIGIGLVMVVASIVWLAPGEVVRGISVASEEASSAGAA